MSKRLEAALQGLACDNRKGLFIYVTAGISEGISTAELLASIVEAGTDVIELGLPFSDPMADGPVIQEASVAALHSGMTLKKALAALNEFRDIDNATPVVGMGYFNNVLRYGVENFVRDFSAAGMDGIIIPDLPHEESGDMREICQRYAMPLIEFVTPGTTENRMQEICKTAAGFIYCVSNYGVTGIKEVDYSLIGEVTAKVKRYAACPLAIGFGIGTPEAAVKAAEYSDAVIVGSAVVKKILVGDIRGAIALVAGIRQVLDNHAF